MFVGQGSAKGGPARRQEIKPETDSGSVVWAKTKGYPWWPAQVNPRRFISLHLQLFLLDVAHRSTCHLIEGPLRVKDSVCNDGN